MLTTPVIPGDRLGSERDFNAGFGTYSSRGFVYSALMGFKWIQSTGSGDATSTTEKPYLVVINSSAARHHHRVTGESTTEITTLPIENDDHDDETTPLELSFNDKLPSIGSTVWARVVRVAAKIIYVEIFMAEPPTEGIYKDPFKGQIRAQDIRSYEIDTLKLPECFRTGDVVLAQVISSGDSRGGFLLSTAPIECGVVFGKSAAGGSLEPIAYKFMKCSRTGNLESRKVARPQGAVEENTELKPEEMQLS